MIGPSTRLDHNHRTFHTPGVVSPGAARPDPLHAAPPPRESGGRGAGSDDSRKPNPPHSREASSSGDVCRLLSLLADRTRLRILRILAQGERPVVALTSELRLPQPTVSHHLAWLRMMDLVSPRRQGKHVFYALGPAAQCDAAGVMTLTADDATVTITPYSGR